MYKVINVYKLRPEELEVRLNEVYEQGYKLTAKSNIEWYQGKGEWGIFVFELPKDEPTRCEKCQYCRETKQIKKFVHYSEL